MNNLSQKKSAKFKVLLATGCKKGVEFTYNESVHPKTMTHSTGFFHNTAVLKKSKFCVSWSSFESDCWTLLRGDIPAAWFSNLRWWFCLQLLAGAAEQATTTAAHYIGFSSRPEPVNHHQVWVEGYVQVQGVATVSVAFQAHKTPHSIYFNWNFCIWYSKMKCVL